MDVTNGDEICGRCLVNVNAATSIRAVRNGHSEEAPQRSPRGLKLWMQEKLYNDGCRFEIDATTDRVEAISTWYGDPVCSYHLWLLADQEQKRGYK